MPTSTLQRETFKTSRLLEYFSEQELILQTGHEPETWPQVVIKELVDNALDACEEAGTLPGIAITITKSTITVEDNGPGLRSDVVDSVLDYSIRTSSKQAYVSPTRGAQGNALKTVIAIPFVLSGCQRGGLEIVSQGMRHQVTVTVDPIAQQPKLDHAVAEDDSVKTGTRVGVTLPNSACSLSDDYELFLQIVQAYALFNPHADLEIRLGKNSHRRSRTVSTCSKWIPSAATSPHWYTEAQLRNLIAAYVAAERQGARARTVREFISEFRGLSGTAKQKAILGRLPIAGGHLHDLVKDGDVDRKIVRKLLSAMRAVSKPVKPDLLGVLGESHVCEWLKAQHSQTVTYKRISGVDDEHGLPFVLEVGVGIRNTRDSGRAVITGINFSPTLVDPFRALNDHGLSLDGLLGELRVEDKHPVTVVVHLTCPHLNYTDRGKSSLETL
jgi:DNA topoisomerase VI subunit B